MKVTILTIVLVFGLLATAVAQDGLVSVKSSHDVLTTANRLEAVLKEKGVTVFARIDHAAGAQRTGQVLKPTLLVIFGNPVLGTPLIQRSRTMGLDLPLKVLIWEDRAAQIWFTYFTAERLARRHGITEMADIVQKIDQALSNFAAAATQP